MGTYSTVSGRLGDIFDLFYYYVNETAGGTDASGRFDTDMQLLMVARLAIRDLASRGAFKEIRYWNITAGVTEYDWRVLLPDTEKIINVELNSTASRLYKITDFATHTAVKPYFADSTEALAQFTSGHKTYLTGTPSADVVDGFIITRNYIPPAPCRITLAAAAVVDNGDGTVAVQATIPDGLAIDDEIYISGTVNYDGRHFVTAVGTASLSFAATYVAETLSASDLCYLQPRGVQNLDTAILKFLLMSHYGRDKGNKQSAGYYKLYAGEYEKAAREMLASQTGELRIRPVRG